MFEETYHFVQYVFENNLSIMNFIDSDFAMLNQNLLSSKKAWKEWIRPVTFNKNQREAYFPKVLFWVDIPMVFKLPHQKSSVAKKEKILGDHPAPPPNVPELIPKHWVLKISSVTVIHRNKVYLWIVIKTIHGKGLKIMMLLDVSINCKKSHWCQIKITDGTEIDDSGLWLYIRI